MDNVMFQVECALNPSSSDVDGGDAASLLKRYVCASFGNLYCIQR